MGTTGPAPKRTEERIRRADPAGGPQRQVEVAELESVADPSTLSHAEKIRQPVTHPPADPAWHRLVRDLYDSAEFSAQTVYWEPSDWQMLRVACESLNRDLEPQPVRIGTGESAYIEMVEQPIRGASLNAYSKILTLLGFTEDARRRMGIEIQRKQFDLSGKADLKVAAPVADIEDARASRLA